MFKRRLKLLGKILLGFIVLLAAFLLFERFRGQFALAKYKRELSAKGEKLSAKDFAKAFDKNDNGAPAVFAAIERLTNGVILPDGYPPRMRLLESGRAIVGFREPQWVEKNPYRNGESLKGIFTNHWTDLAADLQANAAMLAEIQAGLEKPVLNNQLDLTEGVKMKFHHLAPAKALTYWLGSASQLALHEGRTSDATKYLVSQINLPRLLAEDGIVISELVRIAIGAIARVDTWEALQADGWTDADLATLQQAWEQQEFIACLARNLVGERIYCEISSEQMRASNEETYQMIFGEFAGVVAAVTGGNSSEAVDAVPWESISYGEALQAFTRKQVYCRVWRFAWSRQAQLRELQLMQELIALARLAAKEKSFAAVSISVSNLDTAANQMGFYDRLRFPGPGGFSAVSGTIAKAMRLETDRSLALGAIAIKRYSLRYGKLPESLTVLVPEFISTVPTDYINGHPHQVSGKC